MTPRHQRQFGVFLAIAALLLFGRAPAAASSSADELQAEAARVQSQVDAQAERIAALDREVKLADGNVADADAAVGEARAGHAEASTRMAETRRRLAGEAVRAYVEGNPVSILEQMSGTDGRDIPVRNHYRETAVGSQREALEDLKAARDDLGAESLRLQEAQHSARSAAARLAAQRRALARGERDQRANLSRVQAELSRTLADERARRNEAVLRRAENVARSSLAPRSPRPAPPSSAGGHRPPGGVWACIRQLESSNNYRAPRGGAYQIRQPTWRSLGQPGRAEDAAPPTQDAMAIKLQQRSGWGQWPNTARRCGAY